MKKFYEKKVIFFSNSGRIRIKIRIRSKMKRILNTAINTFRKFVHHLIYL